MPEKTELLSLEEIGFKLHSTNLTMKTKKKAIMKKYMTMAALAVATMGLFTSCSDEDIIKVSTKAGDPIRFTATTKEIGTRTAYGELNGDVWPIYWVDQDQVTIYSPEAMADEPTEGEELGADAKMNHAVYTVVGKTAENATTRYEISGEGLYWGENPVHNFYQAYPSKNVKGFNGSVVTAVMPATQNIDVTNYTTKKVNNVNTTIYAPDMNAALMVGSKTGVKKSDVEAGNKAIDLPFSPLFTAVDITISPAASATYDITSLTIANVEMAEEEAPLAGEFNYDIATGVYTDIMVQNNVQVQFSNPIHFEPTSQPFTVTVMLRGDFGKALKVVVNAEKKEKDPDTDVEHTLLGFFKKQGVTYKREPDDDGNLVVKDFMNLQPGLRNHIDLKELPSTEFKEMTGEWWISHTKDEVYVSDMSLPGSYDSGNFVEGTSGTRRTQTNSIDELLTTYGSKENVPGSAIVKYQLDHGIRVFDMRLRYDNAKGFYVNRNDGSATHKNATILSEFMGHAVQWLKQHTTEFLIVFLQADEGQENAFNSNIKTQIESIMEEKESSDYYLKSYNSNIKVSEARGKILFMTVGGNNTPIIGNKVSSWSVDDKWGIQTSSFANGGGEFSIHDKNELRAWEGFTYWARPEHKEEDITTSIENANSDTNRSNWHVTCNAAHTTLTYSQCSDGDERGATNYALNNFVVKLVNRKTEPTIKKAGIVLGAYVCTGGTSHGQDFIDAIWKLNYKK